MMIFKMEYNGEKAYVITNFFSYLKIKRRIKGRNFKIKKLKSLIYDDKGRLII